MTGVQTCALPIWGQGLIASHQHDVLEKGPANELHGVGVERLTKLDTAQLRPERRAQSSNFQRHADTFLCRSVTVYSSNEAPVARGNRLVFHHGKLMAVSIHPFDTALGAEVRGLDLSASVDDSSFEIVRGAYEEHSLLLFRDQTLSPEQHIDFSRRFGALEIHVLDQWRHPEHPEILIVSNIKDKDRHIGVPHAGRYWHTDLSYMVAPSRGSLLYAIEIPEQNGRPLGDTR